MKNIFNFFVPLAVAATALVSCNKEIENPVSEPEAITIRVHASVNDLNAGDQETKTYIDNTNAIIWGEGEYMKLALTAGESTTFATSTDASADTSNCQPSATFEFSVTPASASQYIYQGIYPASAAATDSNTDAASYKVNLPAIQHATASSYDPAAYIMVAKPETFTSVQDNWVASFRRGTALNKITLKNFDSSVSINRVWIYAEGKKLAGGRSFNLTTGESGDIYGTDATIDVLYATPLSGTSMDVWFTSWDTEIAEGEKLTIIAYTTDNKSYTKEITVPAGKTIKFQEGYLNILGANMSGISPKTVVSGDFVIIAVINGEVSALENQALSERIVAYPTGISDKDSIPTSFTSCEASIIWTITPRGPSYTIKNGGNYVGWISGSGNKACLVPEASYNDAECLMNIEGQGERTYHISVAAESSRILARNSTLSNYYFAFYGGTQAKDLILVPATALEQVAAPTFDPAEGEVAYGTEVTISSATDGAAIYYTTDGSDPTTSSTQGTSVTITAATTLMAIAVKEGMADSEIAAATYTVAGNWNLESIAVTTEPDKTDYTVGETFNPAGMVVTGHFVDADNANNIKDEAVTGYSITPDGPLATTDTQVTITYQDKTTTQDISVIDWVLESIAVTTGPAKTIYTAGQSFDPAGMVVTGHFVDADDNTNTKDEEITGYTITPDGALATTDTQVTITYQGMTATQAITVNAPSGTSQTVTYTVSSTTAVSTSGTAPTGSSATYSQTFGTKCQITKSNSITLTLSGYEGKKITGASVSMHSNSSKGAGSLSLESGGLSIAYIAASQFNSSNWYGAWSTSYVSIPLEVIEIIIDDNDTIVLNIAATENSLYFESLTLTYQ